MATIALEEQNVFSWGGFRAEQGKFTFAAGATEVQTKLGFLIWAAVQPMETNVDAVFPISINSITASAVEDDPGFFHIPSGMTAGEHTYFAIGRG